MNFKKLKIFFMVGLLSSTFVACIQDEDDDDVSKNVDQGEFLRAEAEIMTVAFENAATAAAELNENAKLATDTQTTNLPTLKASLKNSWKKWQAVSFYELSSQTKANINIFKTDTALIERNIQSGNFNLDQLGNQSAKGFPALDYLLNARSKMETKGLIAQNGNRLEYIKALANDISTQLSALNEDWKSSQGNFVANTGTDQGSSTGKMVNALNLHFEKFFRDNKIGIPLGVRSSGIERPDFCEAVYGGYSVELALDNLAAMKNAYFGINVNGTNGYGLDDYLTASDAASLNSTISNQLETIKLKLQALSDPLPAQIANDSQKVQEAYTEMQKLIVLWKVDMPSRMGVLITYQDNDGD